MANYYTDNEDLQFYVDRAIQWAPLVESTEYGFRAPDCFRDPQEALDFYRETLTTIGEIAANEIGAKSAQIDHEGNACLADFGLARNLIGDSFLDPGQGHCEDEADDGSAPRKRPAPRRQQ